MSCAARLSMSSRERSKAPALDARRAGILLHPTSLPGPGSNGTLGAPAEQFMDFLNQARVRVWQMLPLTPPHADGSPYQCQSIHAGNTRLIDLQRLVEWGWLSAGEASRHSEALVAARQSFSRISSGEDADEFAEFVAANQYWLEDYALYRTLKSAHGGAPWWSWPTPARDRERAALEDARLALAGELDQCRFEQFVFHRQWRALRRYASNYAIRLFGDMPIFVAEDSADVWAGREHFKLNADGRAVVVAGVPPDAFSASGQRWGNPHYDWDRMRRDDFLWWRDRLRSELQRFDLVRIDHFRGFVAAWEIPARAADAIVGEWVEGPGESLFHALTQAFPSLPVVAEDLGMITPEVLDLRARFSIPGMKILQFAFDSDSHNPYLPHNHSIESVVYTATHDNDTTSGWFADIPAAQRDKVLQYLDTTADDMPWAFTRAAFASVADLAIVPMQDVLALGSQHRMNTPGVSQGNWRWRFSWDWAEASLCDKIREMVELYDRDSTPA